MCIKIYYAIVFLSGKFLSFIDFAFFEDLFPIFFVAIIYLDLFHHYLRFIKKINLHFIQYISWLNLITFYGLFDISIYFKIIEEKTTSLINLILIDSISILVFGKINFLCLPKYYNCYNSFCLIVLNFLMRLDISFMIMLL
jgi:hypothetical protein